MSHFWIKIDLKTDEIVAVADTQRELAKICGVKEPTIRQSISRAKRMGMKCCYMKVEDEDENNDNDQTI